MKHPWRIWITALILSVAFDLLFWGKQIGVSYPIWIGLALVGAGFLSFSEKKRPATASLVLMAIAFALALMTFLRQEPFTRMISGLLALACLGLLVATYGSGRWLVFRFFDYLVEGARTIWAGFSRAVGLASEMRRARTPDENGKPSAWRSAGPVLRGLLLAAPVVIVLGSLLSSADLVFANRLETLLKIFEFDNWAETLFRLFYILVFAYVFTGLYLHALEPAQTRPALPEGKTILPPFLGYTEAFIVLGSVILLFAVFVVIQFAYLFGGQANIHDLGFTYSEYARRGFGELVFVAVLSLLLYFALASVTRLETTPRQRWFAGMAAALMALVIVILASALQRLLLYEGAYGFTRVRTYTHVLILWMAVALLAAIAIEVTGRRKFFPQALVLAGLCFGLSLGALNVDGYIIRQNVQRSVGLMELDTKYLRTLSDDAVPELFTQFDKPGISVEIHDELGAELGCRAYTLSKAEPQPWQSFHWASYRAQFLFQQHQAALQPYQVTKNVAGKYLSVQLQNRKYFCNLDDGL